MWQLWRGDRQQSAVSRQGPGVTPIYCHTNTLQRLNTLCESYEFTLWLSFIINWEFNLHGWHYCCHSNCELSALSLCSCQLACWCCQDLCPRLCYGSGHGTASSLRYQLLTQCLNIVTSGHLPPHSCWRDVFQFLITACHVFIFIINVGVILKRCLKMFRMKLAHQRSLQTSIPISGGNNLFKHTSSRHLLRVM